MQIVRGKKIETLYDAGQIAKRNEELAAQIAAGPTSDLLVIAVLNNGLSGLQMGDAGFFLIKGLAILAALTLRSAARFLPAGRVPRVENT